MLTVNLNLRFHSITSSANPQKLDNIREQQPKSDPALTEKVYGLKREVTCPWAVFTVWLVSIFSSNFNRYLVYLTCSGETFEVFQRFIKHVMTVDLRGKVYYSKGGSGGLSYISCKYQHCFRKNSKQFKYKFKLKCPGEISLGTSEEKDLDAVPHKKNVLD